MAGRSKTSDPAQAWLLPQSGRARHGAVADVVIGDRSHRIHTFAVPDELRPKLAVGGVVSVPHPRTGKPIDGLCVRLGKGAWTSSRPDLIDVRPGLPLLTPALVELGEWVAAYYHAPAGRTFAALVPAAARRPRWRIETWVRRTAAPAPPRTGKLGRAVLALLESGPRERRALLRAAGASGAVLKRLIERKLVDLFEQRATTAPPPAAAPVEQRSADGRAEDAYELTDGQKAAVAALESALDGGFSVHLLFGVPGSGKTEVYVRAMRAAAARGRQSILLVPEIVLATQIVARLARRFERVAVLHSRLSARQRLAQLQAIAAGAVDVVIGTRSATFVPCPRLGLIIVDEEQEPSYKALAQPLLHARDVSIKRAQLEGVPIVLGSATPSLESWFNARMLPHYRLLRLPQRVPGAELPASRVIQAASGRRLPMSSALSPELIELLRQNLARRAQAVVLLNRRGYALFLRCRRCGLLVSCLRCGARLVLHRADNALHCHRCGTRGPAPPACLDNTCGGVLERIGLGVQRVEEELAAALPEARILRLDRDTLRRAADYRAAVERMLAHDVDVLLGTQVVAKGLDFPQVRLVGVIEADAGLALPDFRAGEHVFALLMQVVGRAGRRAGESLAVVQSDDAGSPLITRAVRMDYEGFAADELEARRRWFLPPFSRLIRCVLADERPGRARQEAERLAANLRTVAERVHPEIRVDEAQACSVPRLHDRLRWNVLVRLPRALPPPALLAPAATARVLSPRVRRFRVDVDPIDML